MQTCFAIHGFIMIEVHYIITKYSKKFECEKLIKSMGFLNVLFKYYQVGLILNALNITLCFDNQEIVSNQKF